MFERLRARIADLRRSPLDAVRDAAPAVLARVRADLRTRRGNVPEYANAKYPHFRDVPIRVEARADNSLDVQAVGWAMEKAAAEGKPAGWAAIVSAALRRRIGT